jgi:hypothetical protein
MFYKQFFLENHHRHFLVLIYIVQLSSYFYRCLMKLFFLPSRTDGVHAVHGGLWPYQAPLRQRSKKGSFLLQESAADKSFGKHDGILGLSVNNLLGMFDIPAFDFVYLDMEGSEAVVFSGAADLRWLSNAKVVAIKVHNSLGKYFGIEKKLVQHVSAAFTGRNFHVVADDIHIILISGEMMLKIPNLGVPQQQQQEEENVEETDDSSSGNGGGNGQTGEGESSEEREGVGRENE